MRFAADDLLPTNLLLGTPSRQRNASYLEPRLIL